MAGILLAVLGMGALYGALTVDPDRALETENGMYEMKVQAREIEPDEHKRSTDHAEQRRVVASTGNDQTTP